MTTAIVPSPWTGLEWSGYRLGDNGKLDDDPHEQEAIRAMVELRRHGLSFAKTGAELEFRSFHGRNGQRLSAKVIRDIIRRTPEPDPSPQPA